MTRYTVTVTATLEYDTDEQTWIETAEDVRQDVIDLLFDAKDSDPEQFDITVVEEGAS